jgi:LPXTG-motif cell wall-anchored protein
MLHEAVNGLNIKPNGKYVDCTTGGGGHSYEIASRLSKDGHLFCFDRDPEAIAAASKRLEPFKDKITFVNKNFCEAADALDGIGIDGVIIDLGVSSYQLDNPERGFSMTDTKEVATPLFASVITDNSSLIIIIGGVIIIAGIILILYFRKRRKEGKKDEAKDEQTDTNADEENE